MTQLEFKLWVNAYKLCYPETIKFNTGDELTLWYNCLKDLPLDVAKAALQTTFMTNEFEPKTVAKIRENAVKVTDDTEDWFEAWAKVQKNVQKYGSCRYDPDRLEQCLSEFDDLTKQTVQQLGWKDICACEVDKKETLRAQFRGVYDTLRNRQKMYKQLAPGLQQKAVGAIEG